MTGTRQGFPRPPDSHGSRPSPRPRPAGSRPSPRPRPAPRPKPSAPARVKRRPIESRLPAGWRRRRERKRARLSRLPTWKRVGRRLGLAAAWLTAGLLVLVIVATVGFYTLSNVPRPDELPLPQVATIQFADGSPMARVGDINRTIVPLSRVPEDVRWAVLAAEDRNFYSEPGISVRGMLRAAWDDVFNGGSQGGSTITQQYAKNTYLSSVQTLSRKLRELAIAVKLDQEYSKDQILEFYLNTVYFGRGAYGIEAAAQAYFGVDVDKLTLPQGALLAGLLQSPSTDDPAVDQAAARNRWQYVLDGMVATGHLTTEAEQRLAFPATVSAKDGTRLGDPGPNGLIIRQVYTELAGHGITADQINTGGYVIRTTIDPRAQNAALKAIAAQFTGAAYQASMQKALVAVNPGDGAVVAYYGGADGAGFDYASQGFRPAGSSFKPYTLATALTQNVLGKAPIPLAINSLVNGSDGQTVGGVKVYNDPGDANVSYPQITLADAMKYSLNTVFAQLAQDLSPDNVAKLARSVTGIPSTTPQGLPTLQESNGVVRFGIGIGDYPVRPIDQATGFATFASGGVFHQPYFVRSVTDASGGVVYSHADNPGNRVLDPRVANDVTLTLEPVARYSNAALAGGRPSAAKTGTVGIDGGANTTSNVDHGNSDAWMVGYTPQVSAAVWVGTGQNLPIVNAGGRPEYGSDLPAKTWKLFLDTYLAGQPNVPLATRQQVFARSGTAAPTPTGTPGATRPAAGTPAGSTGRSPVPSSTVLRITPSPPPTFTSPAQQRTVSPGRTGPPVPGRSGPCSAVLC